MKLNFDPKKTLPYLLIGVFNLGLITSLYWILAGRSAAPLHSYPGLVNLVTNLFAALVATILWNRFIWTSKSSLRLNLKSVLVVLVIQIAASTSIGVLTSNYGLSPMESFFLITPVAVLLNLSIQGAIRG